MNQLDLTFVALSDPTRRSILARLRQGSATIHQLAEPFGISQQAVSKHVACLEQARLLRKQRQGREVLCSLSPTPMREASTWMEDYRQHWDGALDRLEDALHEMALEQKAGKPDAP